MSTWDEEEFRRDERVRLAARLMDPTAGMPVPPSLVTVAELIERGRAPADAQGVHDNTSALRSSQKRSRRERDGDGR